MKIVIISDTHGDHLKLELPAGDIIVHAGDMTAHGERTETLAFLSWFDQLPYNHKILVAGNHDWFMETHPDQFANDVSRFSIQYLKDSGVTIENTRFWGSPYTPQFFNWAFQYQRGEEMAAHWSSIPEDTQILITHGPPQGILDQVPELGGRVSHAGCYQLLQRVRTIQPAMHIFGHIHEGYGETTVGGTRFINASSMDAAYRLRNPPVCVKYRT